jgi:drug/metabolite transporter (DMT)-like permease
MKLMIFIGLIVFSLFCSLLFSRNALKNNKKPLLAIIKALLINIIILGLGSIWWFLTERDGISQAIGVMIYLGSIVGISLIDIVFVYVWNGFARTD